MAVKNPTQWRPPSGKGYVIDNGSYYLITNLSEFLVTNSGDNLITNESYVIPKYPTEWTASGV